MRGGSVATASVLYIVLAVALGLIPGAIEFVRRLIEPDALVLALIAAFCGTAFWLLRRRDATEVFATTVTEAEAGSNLASLKTKAEPVMEDAR